MLDDGFQRDVLFGHAGGQSGENAGPVVHGQAHEIAALMGPHTRPLIGFEQVRRPAERRCLLAARLGLGDVGQIADHRRCGGVAAGAGPDVVRLSVGIEDVKDIIADLEQALAKA